jgi:hypothetical protein
MGVSLQDYDNHSHVIALLTQNSAAIRSSVSQWIDSRDVVTQLFPPGSVDTAY